MAVDGNSFTLEETESADGGPRKRVVLKGRDAPLGGRGSGGAFERGVQVRQSEFYYPGSSVPSRQVMGVKYGAWNVKGNLQDRGVPGRALAIVTALESLATRHRRLRIAWGPWEVFGLVDEAKCSPEGLRDFNYDLTLHIDGPALPETALVIAQTPDTTPADLARDTARARVLAAAPIDAAAAGLTPEERAGLTGAQLLFVTASDTLVTLVEGSSDLFALTPAASGRIQAAAASLATESATWALLVASVAPTAQRGWQAAVAWQRAQHEAAESAWQATEVALATGERLDRLARGEAESTVTAREGDTLESIARDRLGDERRAFEIARRNNLPGLRVDAGQRLSLPAR